MYRVVLLDCGLPTSPANGNVSYSSTDYKATAIFQCNPGYVAETNISQAVCLESGLWSTQELTCTVIGKVFDKDKNRKENMSCNLQPTVVMNVKFHRLILKIVDVALDTKCPLYVLL